MKGTDYMSNYLGQKIRELRRRNDLTQEKLADYLNVSYQSVSKWETGIVAPDLSFIIPLARFFKVSTDELLGYELATEDERRQKLKDAYDDTFKSGELTKRLEIARQAVYEYPGDMEWLSNLAGDLSCHYWDLMFAETDEEIAKAELEESIRSYKIVLENSADQKLREAAIRSLVFNLSAAKRKEEAKRYIELYPEEKRKELMVHILEGEELVIYKQEKLMEEFNSLVLALSNYKTEELELKVQLIKLFIPDGNYLDFNSNFCWYENYKTKIAISEERYDDAVVHFKNAVKYAAEYDEIVYHKPDKYRFTAPMFNKVVWDTSAYYHVSDKPLLPQLINDLMSDAKYEPIKNRVELKEFLKLYPTEE